MDCKNISCCFSTSADTSHKTVLLEITNRCNLACGYCHAHGGHFTDIILSEDRMESLFKEMKEAHITKVIFSGGEPILHNSLRKYVDIAEQYGFECDICTNGTVISADTLNWLKKHFKNITITLDTVDPDIFAKMKGCDKKLFFKVLDSIKALIDVGVGVGITIVPTINNYDRLEETIAYFSEIGVHAISILRLYRIEGAKHYLFDENIFYGSINKIIAPYHNIKFRLKGFGLQPETMGKCPAGENMFGIGYDGKLYPCLLLRNPEWSCDLTNVTFTQAVNSSTIQKFLDMRRKMCKRECSHNSICQFGCPAAGYIENGNLICDIRCEYNQPER